MSELDADDDPSATILRNLGWTCVLISLLLFLFVAFNAERNALRGLDPARPAWLVAAGIAIGVGVVLRDGYAAALLALASGAVASFLGWQLLRDVHRLQSAPPAVVLPGILMAMLFLIPTAIVALKWRLLLWRLEWVPGRSRGSDAERRSRRPCP